jgi:hypothetical protein
MDVTSKEILKRLFRQQRISSLGTLRDGTPFVSMVLFCEEPDFSAFYIHTSRLAHHTQDLIRDPRVGLMIAEVDTFESDPQALARISIRGEGSALVRNSPEYESAKALYLTKFPYTTENFSLADFGLYIIKPHSARFVAGFGKIFNLLSADLKDAARD